MAKIESQDMGARYGGRYLVIQIFVNTDEDGNKVMRRVTSAARGIKRNAAMGTLEIHGAGEQALANWAEIAKLSADAAADPGAGPIDLQGEE